MKQPDVLQFLINKRDHDLPSCLQVLWHVYRRGLDWFQQHWSFRLGLAMCIVPPFGTWMMRTLDKTDSFIAIPLEQDGSRPSLLFSGTVACIQKRSGLVPTASVLWFVGLPMMCFGLFDACTHTAGRNRQLYCNSS
jgi:hypothetical protein